MTAVTVTPSLRAIVLDALHDAYWGRRAEIEGCRDCARIPAGICADHQEDNALACEYEDARKQIERNPADAEVLAVSCGIGDVMGTGAAEWVRDGEGGDG